MKSQSKYQVIVNLVCEKMSCFQKFQKFKCLVKNTVQKPVAMKYKSKKPSPIIQKLPNDTQSSTNLTKIQLKTLPVRVKSAKRTLTCYICGKEFGTASLPLHEPKCLEVR